jgi:hypothetical protein
MKTKNSRKNMNTLVVLTPKQMIKIYGGDGFPTEIDFIKY